MRRLKYAFFLLCCFVPEVLLTGAQSAPDAQEIVRRSVQQNQKDWQVAPEYKFTERDSLTKNGKTNLHTYKVVMIDGSPYNELIAEDGRPLSPEQTAAEEQKMQQETEKRRNESPEERRRRINAYEHSRSQENKLMKEMVNAFNFSLAGHEQMNGHDCYVLNATPRPGYQPTSNETKVLAGMRGRMWIDSHEYQWVKVQAEVFRPVSIAFFMAHVEPGTEFLLEKSAVGDGVWLPTHFVTRVRAKALAILSKNYTSDEQYFDYHR